MIRYFAFFMTMAVGCLASFGQNSAESGICPTAKTQTELNICASDAAKRADVELNAVYATLLSKVSGDHVATNKVKSAERAWVAYRDAYMEAMYPATDKQTSYGSIFPMEADLLRARLTREQVNALRDLLEHYSEPS